MRQHPDDDRRLWDLAYLLEQRVRVPTRRRPASIEELRNNPLAQEVIALHLKAARLTKLSVHRGTYYHDAARMYGRLRDDQRQYHYVRLALKETPYVHAYWSDLRDSCLRLGKIDESRRAAANARKWLLPSAQLPGPEAVPAPPSRF